MFTIQRLSETIEVQPSMLTKNFKTKLLEVLREKKDRSIIEGIGIIKEVLNIVEYENPLVIHSKIFCGVKYDAISFKPSIGEKYSGQVTNILPLGIIIECESLVRVLIQASTLPDSYKYDKARSVFTNNLSSIGVGSVIEFRIKSYKIQNGKVDCICTLIPPKITPVVENSDTYVLEPPEY